MRYDGIVWFIPFVWDNLIEDADSGIMRLMKLCGLVPYVWDKIEEDVNSGIMRLMKLCGLIHMCGII